MSFNRMACRLQVGIAIVMMAFLARALVPAGYMIAPAAGPGLVICTGHGPVDLSGGAHHPGAPPQTSDTVCAFSGLHFIAPQDAPTRLAARVAWAPEITPIHTHDQAPGRGLAAPPPPSHGPPRHDN
jgi:hypothetical protein